MLYFAQTDGETTVMDLWLSLNLSVGERGREREGASEGGRERERERAKGRGREGEREQASSVLMLNN